MFAKDVEEETGAAAAPFVAANRRNTMIGRYKGVEKTKMAQKKKGGITKKNQVQVSGCPRPVVLLEGMKTDFFSFFFSWFVFCSGT